MNKFKKHDPVQITSHPETLGPTVGMQGYIEEVHDNDYYTFREIAQCEDVFFDAASGGIKGEFLSKDDDPVLIKAIASILEDKEKRFKESMKKGDEVKNRVTKLAKKYRLTFEQAWEISEGVDKIREEVHSPYYKLI